MSLEIPDQVRKTVMADGNESWLDELPGVVESLAQEWSLMIGPSFAGGHAALAVAAEQKKNLDKKHEKESSYTAD